MSENYQIDKLDKNILSALMEDARVAYAELGKRFQVSPGTIHVRVEKMKQAGIIEGTQVRVNAKKLGYDVCCFVGVNLKSAGYYHEVVALLSEIDEVVEAYYTTGQYSVFVKLMTQSIEQLQWVLIDKIQSIEQVQSTETLISLQNPILRDVNP
ncbi:MAG: Lrp/AsnC family transcriptional regulator for asnA, asnC and gidA [Phenylobacterium sp.]|jgi:Lrp/AsnC family transcriptional regulator for asnA, asnC and gidA